MTFERFENNQVFSHIPETVRAYGCVKCQTHHYEGEPLFQPHIYHQSKHGMERRPCYTDERFEQIVANLRNDGPERSGGE